MIGTCGFSSFDFANNSAEVGYVINPAYQKRGYAPEALLEVMMFGFMELNLHRIEARYMDGNDASRKINSGNDALIHIDDLLIFGKAFDRTNLEKLAAYYDFDLSES